MFYQQRMIEEFTIDEILKKTDSLYKSYEDIYKYIIDYNSKFDTIDSYSAEILNLEKHDSYEAILIKLVGNNLEITNDYLLNSSNKLENIRKFTLSEIAHKKLKEIELQIDNPFFYRKLRKDYRKYLNVLDKLDEAAINDFENFNELEFENVIERLRNFEYEIEDEKRSGSYNIIAKSAVWGIPILIGLYQLIAMNFINFNPYLPLIFYAITILMIYISLKSISNIKFFYFSLKKDKSILFTFFISISAFLMTLYVNFIINLPPVILSILFILFIILLILLISMSKSYIEINKNKMIRKELIHLAGKYKIVN